MGLKGRVMELLRVGDEQALGALVAAEPRATRHLLGRLWDPDEVLRQRAARGIGAAAAAHPENGIDLTRRLMWALNDESATNGVYGIPALGQIGRRAPDLVAVSEAVPVGVRVERVGAEVGLLFVGDSGVGKSETVLDLVEPEGAVPSDEVDLFSVEVLRVVQHTTFV